MIVLFVFAAVSPVINASSGEEVIHLIEKKVGGFSGSLRRRSWCLLANLVPHLCFCHFENNPNLLNGCWSFLSLDIFLKGFPMCVKTNWDLGGCRHCIQHFWLVACINLKFLSCYSKPCENDYNSLVSFFPGHNVSFISLHCQPHVFAEMGSWIQAMYISSALSLSTRSVFFFGKESSIQF